MRCNVFSFKQVNYHKYTQTAWNLKQQRHKKSTKVKIQSDVTFKSEFTLNPKSHDFRSWADSIWLLWSINKANA